MFNPKTTVKNLYQEKEINERIRQKLDTQKLKKQQTCNIAEKRPKSKQLSKN